MHHELAEQLTNPGLPRTDALHRRSQQIGYVLRSLHLLRVKADYHLEREVTVDEALQVLSDAKLLATRAGGLP